jgi:hypothetical protein
MRLLTHALVGTNLNNLWEMLYDCFGVAAPEGVAPPHETDSPSISEDEGAKRTEVIRSLGISTAASSAAGAPSSSVFVPPSTSTRFRVGGTRDVSSANVINVMEGDKDNVDLAGIPANLWPTRIPTPGGGSSYLCKLCQFTNVNKGSMCTHIRADCLNKILGCYLCGYKSWSGASYLGHFREKHPFSTYYVPPTGVISGIEPSVPAPPLLVSIPTEEEEADAEAAFVGTRSTLRGSQPRRKSSARK